MRVAFDVDDTLWKIDHARRCQVPDYDLIQVLRWFHANGDDVFVWSLGGVQYAEAIVRRLGLEDWVTVIPKHAGQGIDLAFDDKVFATALSTTLVHVQREEGPGYIS